MYRISPVRMRAWRRTPLNTLPLPTNDSAERGKEYVSIGSLDWNSYYKLMYVLTDPQVALELNIVLLHGHPLSLEDRILDMFRALF